MTLVFLKNVALIRTGLVLSRKEAKALSSHRYPLLNLKSVSSDFGINARSLDVYDAVDELSEEYLTQPDDIVVRLSIPYTAVLITKETAGIVISSNFAIVRAKKEYVLPGYLFWLLNIPQTIADIKRHNTSNMLGAVRSQYYADMRIILPPLVKQRQIAELYRLSKEESLLFIQLAEERQKYYAAVIKKINDQMTRGDEV